MSYQLRIVALAILYKFNCITANVVSSPAPITPRWDWSRLTYNIGSGEDPNGTVFNQLQFEGNNSDLTDFYVTQTLFIFNVDTGSCGATAIYNQSFMKNITVTAVVLEGVTITLHTTDIITSDCDGTFYSGVFIQPYPNTLSSTSSSTPPNITTFSTTNEPTTPSTPPNITTFSTTNEPTTPSMSTSNTTVGTTTETTSTVTSTIIVPATPTASVSHKSNQVGIQTSIIVVCAVVGTVVVGAILSLILTTKSKYNITTPNDA